jgi:hypothetical protein
VPHCQALRQGLTWGDPILCQILMYVDPCRSMPGKAPLRIQFQNEPVFACPVCRKNRGVGPRPPSQT